MSSRFLGSNANHLGEISLAKDLSGVGRAIGIIFLKNQHLGVIVNRECFLCELVIDAEWPKGGIGLEDRHQSKA